MGLFTGLFSSQVPGLPSRQKEVVTLIGIGNFELRIVGEAHYQTALEAICGPRAPKGVNRFATAWLILEDNNSRGKNTVRVEMQGKQVGYLSPEAAILHRQQLMARGMPRANGQCQAVIRGGWVSSDGRKGDYLVWLDIPISYQ